MTRLSLLAGATLAVLSAGTAVAADKLVVVSWGGAYQDAQKQVYFEPFKAANPIELTDEPWDGGVGVLRAKVKAGDSGWDVVQVEADELEIGCEEGLYEKLDFARIGGEENYLPDAVHDCGVGAIVYNFVLGYDKDKIAADKAPSGWAAFFDTATYPGKRALRLGAKVNLEIALIADGVAQDDVYKVLRTPEGVDRAFAKLDTIKKDLVFWKSGAQPPQMLAAGEVVFTSAYNGRLDAANIADKRNFGIVWNQSYYTLDSWVILKGAKNVDAAYSFLDFAGMAENQSKLPSLIGYGVTNPAAIEKIDAKRLPDLPIAPDNFKVARMVDVDFWLENGDALNERFTAWAAQQ